VNQRRHSGKNWNPVTDNLGLWSSALLVKSTAGRGSNGRLEAYGIKKLRALILELAVRGKLVPQDLGDEPAGVLLGKIEEEKKRLDKEGALARQSPLPEVTNDDVYFSLPSGWLWSRLGKVTNYGVTDKAEPEDVDEDTWVLDLEDVEKETSKLIQKTRFSEKPFKSAKNRFSKGDVVYGKLRPYLDKVLVADESGVCTTEMVPVRGYAGIYPFYLRLVMKAPYFIKYADDSTHGMNLPRLGTDKARMALFPLAPLAEQHRIVAKVDELMALCDQLEQQQGSGIEAHQTLVETLLGALTNVASAQEFAAAWKRIAEHFDTLFTTEHSIDQLKQAILQLAVMGKLVAQDSKDGDASELVKRTALVKKRLIEEGEIRQAKSPIFPIDAPERQLPNNWIWTNLFEIGEIAPRNQEDDAVEASFIPMEAISEKYGVPVRYEIKTWGEIKSGFTHFREEDVVLAKITPCFQNGKSAVMRGLKNGFGAGTTELHVYRTINACTVPEYVLIYLKSPQFITEGIPKMTGTAGQKRITRDYFAGNHFPLPPHAEQHRIVAKVDELMSLCDQLKSKINSTKTTAVSLADSLSTKIIQ
jgi:type I restriction enzyme S subunit